MIIELGDFMMLSSVFIEIDQTLFLSLAIHSAKHRFTQKGQRADHGHGEPHHFQHGMMIKQKKDHADNDHDGIEAQSYMRTDVADFHVRSPIRLGGLLFILA